MQWYPSSKVCLQIIYLFFVFAIRLCNTLNKKILMKSEQGRLSSSSLSASNSSVLTDVSRSHRHGRETVEFSVKGPIGVSVNDDHLTNSGCAVLDLIFAAPSQIGELTFRNYYTMWLSILVKTKVDPPDPGNSASMGSLPNKEETTSEWMMSVPKKVMMQHPHYETGSQDIVSIPSSESLVEWKNLMAMRIILRQPSPVWKTFHIEEINVYKDIPRRASNKESAAESLMMLIKRQTIAALKWTPQAESTSQQFSSGYEFTNLPQP